MQVTLVHPLKHHAYYSCLGILNSKHSVEAVFGMYNKDSIFDRLLMKIGFEEKMKGYTLKSIDACVYTELQLKLLFLFYKRCIFDGWTEDVYFKSFQRRCVSRLMNSGCVHVFQDYCNNVIRYAKDKNKLVVYEQIQVFDIMLKRILAEEVRKVGYLHEYVRNRFPEEKTEKQLENIEMVDYIHTASQLSYDSILEVLGEKGRNKLLLWPYGSTPVKDISPDFLEERVRYQTSRRLKILFVGSICLIKGVHYLIEAISKLPKDSVEFTIIGKPLEATDKVLVQQLLDFENVRYLESVPHIRMGDIYRNNDIFVFPGICEGFGMVTLEAMSYGLPCIVTENSRGVVIDGYDGFVVKPLDSYEIQKKIDYFINNRNVLKDMSINALKTSCKYTWDRYCDNFTQFYNGLE